MACEARTAEQLKAMSPADQDAVFESSIPNDLDEVPADFLTRVRAQRVERTAGVGSPKPC